MILKPDLRRREPQQVHGDTSKKTTFPSQFTSSCSENLFFQAQSFSLLVNGPKESEKTRKEKQNIIGCASILCELRKL